MTCELEFPRATLPWAPLEAHILGLLRRDGEPTFRRNIAEKLGIGMTTVRNYQFGSPLYPLHADRYAVALGLHPCSIWGDEWWQSYEIDRQHQLALWRNKNAAKRKRDRHRKLENLVVTEDVR